MSFQLNEDHEELRSLARQIADEKLAPWAAIVDAEGRFPDESVQALIDAHLHVVGIPEAYGGQGADLLASAVVAEQVARVCVTTQQVTGANELFSWPLLLSGSEEVKAKYLPRIASGEWLGAFGLTEPEAGSDVGSMTTRATRDGDHWVLKGTKRWITNAGRANVYVVFAVTDPAARSRGISAFVVEATDDGLSFGTQEKKMGIKGSPTAEVYLENVRIPADRIVGAEGSGMKTAMMTLDRTRCIVAAQALGLAQGALDAAAAYAKERHQFGQPIANFQGIQFMLADMDMKIRAARLLTYAAAEEAERNGPDMSASGAAAKCYSSDTAMAVTTDAVQILGGSGYVNDFPVERMMRDAKITQIYEGTNQIQRIVIARSLLAHTK